MIEFFIYRKISFKLVIMIYFLETKLPFFGFRFPGTGIFLLRGFLLKGRVILRTLVRFKK